MKKFNSLIKVKFCKCGCGKPPKIGYKGYASINCIPEQIKAETPEKYNPKIIAKKNKLKIKNISRQLHKFQQEINNTPHTKNNSKSSLLKIADNVFSKYIKKRDADNHGNVICICCKQKYNLNDKNSNGEYIVQTLHFVPRTVYSRRYCKNNCHAGCCYCNQKQFNDPYGETYQKFKEFLYSKIGVEAVWMMEAEKRNINKLSHNDLEDIIKKYSITKK